MSSAGCGLPEDNLLKILFAESHNLDRPDPLGSHQYIRLFQNAGHDCLWLGPAVSPLHLFKPDALNRHRFKIWRKGIVDVAGVGWLAPLTMLFYYNLPLLRSIYAGRNQYRFCLPPLAGQLKKAGFGQVDLLWCAGPVAYSLLDLVPHRLSCYRLADRLDRFSGIPGNVGELQKELIRRVDFVLATSRSLWEWARSVREEEVYYLPNGVSAIFFDRYLHRPADFPADGLPAVTYVGTIDTRFDLETLAHAVKAMPDLHFLLIGPLTFAGLEQDLQALQKESNFTWLGAKPYEDLPAYMQSSSAGIIPFHLNDLTEAVNPIKYYEYLASGLPVVAPPMRELTAMEGPLYSYHSREQFCAALRQALEAQDKGRSGYMDFAKNNTWEKRFSEVLEIVGTKLSAPAVTEIGVSNDQDS